MANSKCSYFKVAAATSVLIGTLSNTTDAKPALNGAQIAREGNGRGAACMSCHGVSGEGTPAIGAPRIAGLSSSYQIRQLENFANGTRVNALMAPIAKTLTPPERVVVTEFYEQLVMSEGTAATPAADTFLSNLGEQLALRGRWNEQVPACTQCHGNHGVGVGVTFPALAGQSALYLENQLHAWQSGSREPGPQNLMGDIAKKLSNSDIKAVAQYFSAQPIPSSEHRS